MLPGLRSTRALLFALSCTAWAAVLPGCGEGNGGPGRGRATAQSAGKVREAYSAEVVAITDGDTLRVLHEGKEQRVRLHGVDCPEAKQAYGTRAKQLASSLAFGKVVEVQVHDTDKYGRTVARIVLPDGRDLAHELVRSGLAWWYRHFAQDEHAIEALEQEARSARRGLWEEASPTAPWEFREQQKSAPRRAR